MLNLKKVLTKLCERVVTKSADVQSSYRTGLIHFRKMGDIVICYTANDFTNLPSGGYTTIATIPEGFRPKDFPITARIQNSFSKDISIEFMTTGEIRVYNYSSAITTNSNGAFFAVWSTV